MRELVGGQGQPHLDYIDCVKPPELLPGLDVLPQTDTHVPHPSCEWRAPFAAAALHPGLDHVGLGGFQPGASLRQLGLSHG